MKALLMRASMVVSLVAVLAAKRVPAQVPVGFLPGLNEDVSVWYSAGGTLQGLYNISPFYPNLTTTDAFSSQRSALGSLDTGSVLVGHSNGGIVARYKAQSQKLRAVITYGTPNYGAPLVETFPDFCDYIGGTLADIAFLGFSLIEPDDDWVLDELNPDYDFIAGDLGALCDDIVESLGLTGGVAGAEAGPHGAFINDTLDLAANVSTEGGNAGLEASVVMVTDNFYDAGEWKAALPDGTGEAIGHIQQDVGAAAEGLAAYIELNYPDDDHMLDVATHLEDVGGDFLYADEAWCDAVSGALICYDNDETVPTWSQALGRGHEFDFENGPVHTREAQNAAGPLETVFTTLGIGT